MNVYEVNTVQKNRFEHQYFDFDDPISKSAQNLLG